MLNFLLQLLIFNNNRPISCHHWPDTVLWNFVIARDNVNQLVTKFFRHRHAHCIGSWSLKGQKPWPKADSGDGVLGDVAQSPPLPAAKEFGERCKLSVTGSGILDEFGESAHVTAVFLRFLIKSRAPDQWQCLEMHRVYGPLNVHFNH